MSLVDDSLVNSSSSDDFAILLDAELDSTSDKPEDEENDDDDDDDDEEEEEDLETYKYLIDRTKKRKISDLESTEELNGNASTSHVEQKIISEYYKQFGYNSKSLSELRSDESDVDGALATVLNVLKRVHSMFFDPELGENFSGRDSRQILCAVRSEVLKGCKIVFSRVFPTKFQAENHHLWMLAQGLGATCSTEVDSSVTHVISTDTGTEKSRWAVKEKKFLVEPKWLEGANFLWQRQPEKKFPVKAVKDEH